MSILHNNSYSGFCNEPLKCSICIEKLLQKNLKSISEFVIDKSLPENIKRLRIEIPSNKMNVYEYFSYSGVETILFNVLKTKERHIIQDLRNGDVVFRVYYDEDYFYTLPVMIIDVYFLKSLLPETIKEINGNLKTILLVYTLGKGDIETYSITSINSILEYFDTQLLIGHSFFNKKDYQFLNSFSVERIEEMNYFFENPLIKMNMREVLNNPLLTLFDIKKYKNRWTN